MGNKFLSKDLTIFGNLKIRIIQYNLVKSLLIYFEIGSIRVRVRVGRESVIYTH